MRQAVRHPPRAHYRCFGRGSGKSESMGSREWESGNGGRVCVAGAAAYCFAGDVFDIFRCHVGAGDEEQGDNGGKENAEGE